MCVLYRVELVATAMFNFSKSQMVAPEDEVYAHVCDVVRFINEHQEMLKVNTSAVGQGTASTTIQVVIVFFSFFNKLI